MHQEHLISTEEFCTHYKVEYSFIDSLDSYGLIEITRINETAFIDMDKLSELEKLVRLHNDLEINLEGIEVITYLLHKIKNMQNEIALLRNRLSLYENNDK
ncbi:MAG TPA: chaperone modulator CbpM [Chitinophagaceae bacterium]|nr:chaperone modulator CbpM [Chitinophagaceae bacterium]